MTKALQQAAAERGTSRPPDVLGRIRDRYPELRPAEQAVADLVLSNVRAAVDAPISEIAAQAGVSQPTVTRFSRSVGCEGVRDFKLQLAQSLAVGQAFLVDTPAQPAATGDLPPFWGAILEEAHMALRAVERGLDPAGVNAAAERLAAAGRIVCFGLGGSSATLAAEAQVRLFRYGLAASVCPEPYIARMTAATLKAGDVLLACSATGRTAEVVETAEIARRYGAEVIAITAPGSDLAQAADIALAVRVAEYPDALTPSASRIAHLAVLDLVATATGYRLGPSARESLRRIKFNLMDAGAGGRLEPLGG